MKITKSVNHLLNGIINALSLLFWLLVIFAFNLPYVAVLTVICAIIHELGHLTPLFIFGNYKKRPRSTVCGFRITVPELLSYNDSLVILISGPCANLIAFVLLFLASFQFGEYFFLFAILNLITAISNLIPVKGYDGYKIIEILLSQKEENHSAKIILDGVSFIIISAMSFLSLYLILKVGEGYWIFFVFFISLLVAVLKSEKKEK